MHCEHQVVVAREVVALAVHVERLRHVRRRRQRPHLPLWERMPTLVRVGALHTDGRSVNVW